MSIDWIGYLFQPISSSFSLCHWLLISANQQLIQSLPAQVKAKGPVGTKKRVNYASVTCGAKVVAANPEAQTPSFILIENKDQYMINVCKAKKVWVILFDNIIILYYKHVLVSKAHCFKPIQWELAVIFQFFKKILFLFYSIQLRSISVLILFKFFKYFLFLFLFSSAFRNNFSSYSYSSSRIILVLIPVQVLIC